MTPLPPEPEHTQTVAAIYAAYEAAEAADPRRRYLGASEIGGPCDRQLWYSFRHCYRETFDGRMLRLFDRGDVEESRMVADLREIGCEVHDVNQDTGEQFEVKAIAGHFSGHMDGCALGIPEAPKTWHVLEFKTHNAKSFKKLAKHGVLAAKPQHYAQMMVYMHLTGMTRALYLAVNKDDETLYSERVRYDKAEVESIMARAERVITATKAPDRPFKDRDCFECRYCPAASMCWGSEPPKPAVPITISCRNCIHATPEMDTDAGRWSCGKKGCTLTDEMQDASCDDHLLIPDLVAFAEVTGGGEYGDGGYWIEYTRPDGKTWKNGEGCSDYSTRELTELPAPLVGAGLVDDVKGEFDATVEDVRDEEQNNG